MRFNLGGGGARWALPMGDVDYLISRRQVNFLHIDGWLSENWAVDIVDWSYQADIRDDFGLHLLFKEALDNLVAPVVVEHRMFDWKTQELHIETI